ncbi:ASF1 like histone chaperone-domain-containing protein [Tuber borchii]|uniref:Histone chaperone n=1 Tax=Tuber borchii TaxID=42251 RepID=A0A2T6ZNF9_TUBBO|nr:ASF1 like histone chaperone-domain-containing protein [Tuber borchii]
MSIVSLLNVNVINNPARFADKYQFEITFECLEPLTKDLEWKLTYVGSANSTEHDQELDSLLVGPIPVGVNKFIFEAEPPTLAKLPSSEILGVTVVLLTCSYDGREFVRVGYYVSNEYDSEELNNEPPKQVQTDRIVRNVLAEKPRVTRFAIKWDSEESAPSEFPPDQPEADEAEDDADNYGVEEEEELEGEEEGGAALPDEDVEMGGADDTAGPAIAKEADEDSDDGSEDLEAESSGEDDEEEEEGEGEAEEDDAMVDDSAAGKSGEASSSAQPATAQPVVPK